MEWRLLAGVSAEDIRRLVAVAQRRTFRRGQVVFHDDDAADALHLVVSGHFAVRVTIPTGESVLLAIVGLGDAFGELALVSESNRGATVQAFSDGETLALHRDAFEALRLARPQVDRSLAVILAERLRRVNDLLTEAHYVDAEVRVRRRLVELGEAFDGTIPLTQEEIAQTAGTSRATVNRVLREEEAAGAVELGRGRTTITDAAALRVRGRGLM
ncbi:MAG TPA: Crp/Fnr family transcriptional regulator [Gaiellaceae bacterium]